MLTADSITTEQIVEATAFTLEVDLSGFGNLIRLREVALRRIDADARRMYGEAWVQKAMEARARCAEILNARFGDEP